MQSKGVIANAKHWVDNSQETNRTSNIAIVDERTQMEVYYPPFEAAIDAGVGSVMRSCQSNAHAHIHAFTHSRIHAFIPSQLAPALAPEAQGRVQVVVVFCQDRLGKNSSQRGTRKQSCAAGVFCKERQAHHSPPEERQRQRDVQHGQHRRQQRLPPPKRFD